MGSNTTSDFDKIAAEISYVIHYINIIIICLLVAGTLLNLWFLVAMLTSRDMRSRLRNKIICNTLVVHLLDSAVIFPASVIILNLNTNFGCAFHSTVEHIFHIQDLMVNWLVVMLLVAFIANIKDFNPRTKLTPKTTTLGTRGLIVLPWLAAVIVTVITTYQKEYSKVENEVQCFLNMFDIFKDMKVVDTVVPIIMAVLLVIVAAVLKYRRFTPRYSSGSIHADLIPCAPEIDNTFAYVAAVVVCIFCDFLATLILFSIDPKKDIDWLLWIRLSAAAEILSCARVILMPPVWLLLPDVRQRVRTWRPWNRSAPDTNLILTYTQTNI